MVQEPSDVHKSDSAIRASFQNDKAVEMWTSCCQRAAQCCQTIQDPDTADPTPGSVTSLTCPPTWDGWTCWQRSLPEQVALAPCPDYIYFETEPPACPSKSTLN